METRFPSLWVADEGRTMCRVADNLEKTIVYIFFSSWFKFFKLDTYVI